MGKVLGRAVAAAVVVGVEDVEGAVGYGIIVGPKKVSDDCVYVMI